MTQAKFIADFSLALINRTGAYHVGRDLLQQLPQFFERIRYWRCSLRKEPHGLARKLLGRAMLMELIHRARNSQPAAGRSSVNGSPTLYLDPLYVLLGRVEARDIVLCHDVGPVTHPDLFDPQTREMYSAAYDAIRRVAPGMVFVSEASRSEFIRCFGEEFRFLRVIPLYVRPNLSEGDGTAPPGVAPPFLLTVGGLEIRKNHARTIEAFAVSGLRERGFSYVFCGPRGNSAEEVEALARVTPGVRALGFVSDAEIRWLYRHASGFVLPSLLEGFGLPALEAAQRGLISLVSTSDAQREAIGEGAVMVEATSVSAIAHGMRQLVDMSEVERSRRLTEARAHATALSLDRYLKNWSVLLQSS